MNNKMLPDSREGLYIDVNGQPAITREQVELLNKNDEFRLLVISDSHRSVAPIVRLLDQVPLTDLVLHLGDHVSDYAELAEKIKKPIIAVKGNCDGFSQMLLPETVYLAIAGHPILMMHGHNRKINVKNGLYRLRNFVEHQKPVPDLVLFGHTHIYHDETFKTDSSISRIINPGSCSIMENTNSGGIEIILNRTSVNIRRLRF